jgi:alpha-glucosidase
VDQYPWSFGADTEKLCSAALSLRYRLLPYLYSAFIEASESGRPIMSPLLFEDQTDLRLADVDDQYLFGPNLLVAPVVKKGAVERQVIFPKGEWFDWWSGVAYERSAEVEAPLSVVPLFARAGAVVPMWPEVPPSTMDYQPKVIDLMVFVPSANGVFRSRLVEDDGTSFGYESGERLVTWFTLTRQGTSLKLEAETRGLVYPGFKRSGFNIVLRGACERGGQFVNSDENGFSWSSKIVV